MCYLYFDRMVKGTKGQAVREGKYKPHAFHVDHKDPGLAAGSVAEPADKAAEQWSSLSPPKERYIYNTIYV